MFMGNLDYVGFNNVSHWAPRWQVCEDTWAHYYQMQPMKEDVKVILGQDCSSPTICYVPMYLRNHHTGTHCWWFSWYEIQCNCSLCSLWEHSSMTQFVVGMGRRIHWRRELDFNPDLSPSYALDFAGGTVVHFIRIYSARRRLILGRRLGYGKVPMNHTMYYGSSWCINSLVRLVRL